jgi:putative oxidoreductase
MYSNTTKIFELTYAFVRVVVGYSLLYHGLEVFDAEKMRGYGEWIPALLGMPSLTIAYIGKWIEFITGVLLILGLLVRPASVIIVVLFLIIAFRVGEGRIFMEEQHPFMFALFGLLFLAKGAGLFSVATWFSSLRRDRRP